MSKGTRREKDQNMAAHLAPSPVIWRTKPEWWPYHNNLGTDHGNGKVKKVINDAYRSG